MLNTTSIKLHAPPVQLAVIGGGPKAAAIASKAWVLRKLDMADVRVTIFEPIRIGAYWAGKAGYTNGEQRLCTIAERDVGYPYNSQHDARIDAAMLENFSWPRYLLTNAVGAGDYRTWVDGGRAPPLHLHYANYLQWVVQQSASQAQVIRRKVTSLNAIKKKWQVTSVESTGKRVVSRMPFDAIVATGPGPAKLVPANGATIPSRMFNGVDFWRRLADVRRCLRSVRSESKYTNDPIVIIGAGGTAAAILAWLLANGAAPMSIQLVSSQASLHTRVDSVFENRLFSDDILWATLSSESRRAFFDRLNRGVVWKTVIDQISSARNLEMVNGRAQHSWVSHSGSDMANRILEPYI